MPDDQADSALLAEVAFMNLARKWQAEEEAAGSNAAVSSEADAQALACVMLAAQWRDRLGGDGLALAEQNRARAAPRFSGQGWFDALPWTLCAGLIKGGEARDRAIEDLQCRLSHSNSGIRGWMMQVAWAVRAEIDPAEALPRLLKNVADTLGGVPQAIGLARGLCASDADLDLQAEIFDPPDGFASQFTERINHFREEGYALYEGLHWRREAECRRLILEALFEEVEP